MNQKKITVTNIKLFNYIDKKYLLIYLFYIISIYYIDNCNTIKIQTPHKQIQWKVSIGNWEAHGSGADSFKKLFKEGFYQGLQEMGIDFGELGLESPEPISFPFEATSLFLFRSHMEARDRIPSAGEIQTIALKQNSRFFVRGSLHYNRDKSPEELLIHLYLYDASGKPFRTFTLFEKSPDWERIHSLGKEFAYALNKEVSR
jgi:hypothetical protein